MNRFEFNSALIVHSADQCYGSVEYFTNCIADELRTNNVEVIDIFPKKSNAVDYLSNLVSENVKCDIAFAFNSPFYDAKDEDTEEYLINELADKIYYFTLDHPFYYHDIFKCPIKNMTVICLDETHADFVKKHYPHIENVKVSPVGAKAFNGCENYVCRNSQDNSVTDKVISDVDRVVADNFRCDYNKRPISVLFTGTYTEPVQIKQKVMTLPKPFPEIFDISVNMMLDTPALTLDDAVYKATKQVTGGIVNNDAYRMINSPGNLMDSGSDSDDNVMKLLPDILYGDHYIDLYMRAFLRENLLIEMLLRKIPVTIYGHGWELFRDKLEMMKSGITDTLSIMGEVTYEKLPEVYSQAKISLNQLPWFKAGLHDRVALSMMNGAVAFTDYNGYMIRSLEMRADTTHFIGYDIECMDEAADKLSNILRECESDDGMLRSISKNAYSYANDNLTFAKMAERIFG